MKNLNVILFSLVVMSASPVYASCPPASSIQEAAGGGYSAQVLGQVWRASGIPATGTSLGAVQGANSVAATVTGPKVIMTSNEDFDYPYVAYTIKCNYVTNGGLAFNLSSPEGKQYKLTNPPWEPEDTRVPNQLNYRCTAANCTFVTYP
jgi:hypothetical protein